MKDTLPLLKVLTLSTRASASTAVSSSSPGTWRRNASTSAIGTQRYSSFIRAKSRERMVRPCWRMP